MSLEEKGKECGKMGSGSEVYRSGEDQRRKVGKEEGQCRMTIKRGLSNISKKDLKQPPVIQ
jgi:hypothetical protein